MVKYSFLLIILMGLLLVSCSSGAGTGNGTADKDSTVTDSDDSADADLVSETETETETETEQEEADDESVVQTDDDDFSAGDSDESGEEDETESEEPEADDEEPADSDVTTLPLDGFGAVTGECGVLDDELLDLEPHFIVNRIDFGTDPYDQADFALLTPGGQEIITDGNAGGSSILSEVFAYELLHRCELAALLKTEMEITYTNPSGKITDLLVEIDSLKIGVSVTRAVAYPFDAPYTVEQATDILKKKLQGIIDSSANVAESDAWKKQILHILAYGEGHSDALKSAFDQIDAALKRDTVVIVTISDGDDSFLY